MSEEEFPWRDKETMESLFEKDLTYEEMAEELGTQPTTVSHWLKRHEITVDFPDIELSEYEDPPYQDPELLERLYYDEMMSTTEIAAFLDCSSASVNNWMDKLGVEKRTDSEARLLTAGTLNSVSFYTKQRGHEIVQDRKHTIPLHRLQAVAEWGVDAVEDMHVHHKNEIPWDNRIENLELLPTKEHLNHHKPDGMTWLEKLRAAEMYREGGSSYDIAPRFHFTPGTIINGIRDVDPELIRGFNGGA